MNCPTCQEPLDLNKSHYCPLANKRGREPERCAGSESGGAPSSVKGRNERTKQNGTWSYKSPLAGVIGSALTPRGEWESKARNMRINIEDMWQAMQEHMDDENCVDANYFASRVIERLAQLIRHNMSEDAPEPNMRDKRPGHNEKVSGRSESGHVKY